MVESFLNIDNGVRLEEGSASLSVDGAHFLGFSKNMQEGQNGLDRGLFLYWHRWGL